MATIFMRTWTSRGPTGRRLRHSMYGYDAMIDGKRERRASAAWQTEAAAMEALTERLKAVAAGQVQRPADLSFGALVEQYLTYKADQKKRSLREDRRILTRRLVPAFGATRPVRQVNETLIAQYEKQRAGQVSAYTVANELTVLRHMLRLGRKWGYLDQVPDIELPKKPRGRERYLDTEEIARLLAACEGSKNPYLRTIVVIALNTGMRKEELLGLTWERVNLSTFTITLYKTKADKSRGIPVNSDLEAALRALEPEPAQRTGLLFQKRDGRRWGQVRTAFEAALARADIKHFRFHDLRHTFASHFVMRGGSLADLKEILGHADIKTTMRYAHLSTQHLRSSMERMEGLTSLSTDVAASETALPHEVATA